MTSTALTDLPTDRAQPTALVRPRPAADQDPSLPAYPYPSEPTRPASLSDPLGFPGVPAPRSMARRLGLPEVACPRELSAREAREISQVFFDRLHALEEGTREYQYVRNALIEMNISLVHYAVRPFRARPGGPEKEDLIQVGTVGLIKAIDRYDPDRNTRFTTLALPYITGEIKRHFRDTSWAVRVPRRLQELRTDLAKATEELSSLLDHAPSPAELAAHLGIEEEEVREGLVAANGYTARSLDTPPDAGASGPAASAVSAASPTLADVMGAEDPAMETVEDLQTLAPLLAGLDERRTRILQLRFGEEMTQAQIGREVGLSQMQVSRILSGTLEELRERYFATD